MPKNKQRNITRVEREAIAEAIAEFFFDYFKRQHISAIHGSDKKVKAN